MNRPVLPLGAVIGAIPLIVVGCAEDLPSAGNTASPYAGTRILYATNRKGNFDIYSVNPDGSGATNLTRSPSNELNPAVSPDGTEVVYTTRQGLAEDIWVMSIDGGNQRQLTDNEHLDSWPAWSPDGRRIAFVSSRDSTSGLAILRTELFVMDADGANVEQVTNLGGNITHPSWSPDGQRIVFGLENASGGVTAKWVIYTVSIDGSDLVNLSETIASDGYLGKGQFPEYSPDGKEIVFIALHRGTSVRVMSAAGGGLRRLTNDDRREVHPSWAPDGESIVYAVAQGSSFDLFVMGADGRNSRAIIESRYQETVPDWSPFPPRQ
jgi:TolB protein